MTSTQTQSRSGPVTRTFSGQRGGLPVENPKAGRQSFALTLPKNKLAQNVEGNDDDHTSATFMGSSTFELGGEDSSSLNNGSFSLLGLEPADNATNDKPVMVKKNTGNNSNSKFQLKKSFGNRSIRSLATPSGSSKKNAGNASGNAPLTREASLRTLDVFGGSSFSSSLGGGSSLNGGSNSTSSMMHRSFSGGLGRLPPKRDRKCGRGAELGSSLARLPLVRAATSPGELPSVEDSQSGGLKKEEAEPLVAPTTRGGGLTKMRSLRFCTRDFVQQHDFDTALEDHYELGELLGEGAFGSVYLGECKKQQGDAGAGSAGAQRAIKIIQKGEMMDYEQEEVINEFHILKNMDHPNILKMYEFFEDPTTFCIVTDLSMGGELYDELAERGRFTESEVALLMRQVLGCCKYLQEHRIVHCDLNLENCLLEGNKELDQIKLIDFGLATKLPEDSEEKLFDLKGKPHYVAPEVLDETMGYDTKYDIWSAGIMAHICLVGYAPFDDEDSDANIYDQILQYYRDGPNTTLPSLQDPEWDDISDEAKDFIQTLLTSDPDARPCAEQALQHPFIVHHRQEEVAQFKRRSSTLAIQALGNMRRRGSTMTMSLHNSNHNSSTTSLSSSSTHKLQEVTCSYIASQLLGQAEKEEVHMVFRAMDLNSDGKLSKEEVRQGYNEYFHTQLDETELDILFRQIDLSGSGYIEYSEFVIATMEHSNLLGGNRLRAAFDNFDQDSTGYISHDNLRETLRGVVQDPKAIEKIIQQIDTNGDGKITYDQFKSLMMVDAATDTPPEATAAATTTEPEEVEAAENESSFANESFANESFAFQDKKPRKSIFDSSDSDDDSDDTDSETEDDTD